jgi:PAS domain S-box-containing protein
MTMPNATLSRERALLDQKEVYRQILDAIADMVLVKGAQSRILWANKAFRDYYGMTNEQLYELIDANFNQVDYTERYIRDDLHVYTSGQVLDIPEEPVTRSDGVVQTFHTVKSPLRDDEGRVVMTVAVCRNITEPKRVKEELARYREHLERLVEERTGELSRLSDGLSTILSSLNEGIVAVDAAGYVQLMNPAAKALLGLEAHEAERKAISELIDFTPERADPEAAVGESLAALPANGRATTGWLRSRRGELRLIEIRATPLSGASGMVLVLRDVALEREVADQRLRRQKLERLGLLAGGIAHDFNNNLVGILANISSARIESARGRSADNLLEQAEQACLRAQSLTTQLLTFARGGAPVKTTLAVAKPVREAAELALRGASCRLVLSAASDVLAVDADEGQLVQAVSNLVLNAKQAMPSGGEVSIQIDNVAVASTDRLPLSPGRYVRIGVRDQGDGIAPEHRPRIFDPYFTTKSTGSGLGLASVHSIVHQHGGYVGVSSTPGAGAEFSLYLPASESKPDLSECAPPRDSGGQSQRVLVLDDDESVRHAMTTLLSVLGHECVAVGHSTRAFEALDAAQRDRLPFDAIFVDLTMPGDLAGADVIAQLVERKTGARLIVMSGYSMDLVLPKFREHGLSARLRKPFTVTEVEEALG